jgi:hypothetical protein
MPLCAVSPDPELSPHIRTAPAQMLVHLSGRVHRGKISKKVPEKAIYFLQKGVE